MPADLNLGRFLVVVALASPSVVAILEYHPTKLLRDPDPREIRARDRWVLNLTAHSLQDLPIESVVERTKARLAMGALERDTTVLVDATMAGALAVRRARVLSGTVVRVSDLMLADTGLDACGAKLIALKDVADAARLAGARMRYATGIPRTVRAKLTADAREGTFTPQTRALALALWHAVRHGGSQFISRRPDAAEAARQWVCERQEREEEDREIAKHEDAELRGLFGSGTS
jgi:hypothetical protein